MDVFTTRGLAIRAIRITGGGARSQLWRQIMADVLGVPLTRPATVETATLGAAILAGCGAGVYESPRSAAHRLVRVEDAETPRAKEHALYGQYFELFKMIYDRLLDCYELARHLEDVSV
jgi:xylulokinase